MTQEQWSGTSLGRYAFNAENHAKILAVKDEFLDIVNQYTVNPEKSRLAGVVVTEPMLSRAEIQCAIMMEFVGSSYEAITESKVSAETATYYLKVYGHNVSSYEWHRPREIINNFMDELINGSGNTI